MADWFDKTWPLYPNPPTHGDQFVPGGSPPWEPSGIYGNLRGWDISPSKTTVTSYLYPVKWFRQMQAYVRALLDNKPGADAPIEDQVHWSLMLMSSVSQGMWALNANDLLWGLACYGNIDAEKFAALANSTDRCAWVADIMNRTDRGMTPLAWGVSGDLLRLVEGRNSGRMPITTPWRVAYEEGAGQIHDSEGSTAGTATGSWPKAPFLHPPLVLDHLNEVHHYERLCGKHNTVRASWWDNWVSQPKSMHVPWALDGWYLMSTNVNPSVIARSSSQYGASGWEHEKLYQDTRATNWFNNRMATKTEFRDQLYARLWKFMSFSYRHNNAAQFVTQWGIFETPSALPRSGNGYIPTLDDVMYGAQLSRGLVPSPFPLTKSWVSAAGTTNRVDRVNWNETFDFGKAYDMGAYDEWARWFTDIDMPSLMEGMFSLFGDYCGQGYIDQADSDTAGNVLIGRSMVAHDDWTEIEKAQRLDKLGSWLGPLGVIVTFIVGIVTLNVATIVGAFVSAIELCVDAGKAKDLMPWQYTYEMPQGFLRSFKRESGTAGWASFDTAHGKTDTILTRMGDSVQDTVAAVQELWPAPEGTQRPVGAPPPSAGGPAVETKPPPLLPFFGAAKKGIDWVSAALWTGAAAVVGYGTWKVLTPKQKGQVRTQTRKVTTPVTRSKPYQKAKKVTAPYRAKAKSAASTATSKARSATSTATSKARSATSTVRARARRLTT